jgi:deoxyinosine 3'endonuclease (endonuclease V)
MENKKLQVTHKMNKYDEYISQVDPLLIEKWKKEQNELKNLLIETDQIPDNLERIAGMDISASKTHPDIAIVALVVCDFKNNFKVLYEKFEFVKMTQPYVPGFLAFREVDHLIKLIDDLKNFKPELLPQLILTDGNGILHSNRFGLACHLGVLSSIPTIGCGKTVFSVDGITKYSVKEASKGLYKGGDFIYLKGNSESIWGAALRCTDHSIDPIIVNIGHKISLDSAINLVNKCCLFRVPEPIRIADKKSRNLIKEFEKRKNIFDIDIFIESINDE